MRFSLNSLARKEPGDCLNEADSRYFIGNNPVKVFKADSVTISSDARTKDRCRRASAWIEGVPRDRSQSGAQSCNISPRSAGTPLVRATISGPLPLG